MPGRYFLREFDGKAEVTDFQIHAVVQEGVANLEISMDDALVLHMLNSGNELFKEISAFNLTQKPAPMEELMHGLVRANLQQQINVFRILEEVLQAHDVRMSQPHLERDFLLEFFLPVLCLQCFL